MARTVKGNHVFSGKTRTGCGAANSRGACARVRERNEPVLSQHERARDHTLRSLNPVAAPRSLEA